MCYVCYSAVFDMFGPRVVIVLFVSFAMFAVLDLFFIVATAATVYLLCLLN